MHLNQDQLRAADAFTKFMLDPDQKEMALIGKPGTGKTFLMNHLLSHLEGLQGRSPVRHVAITATTHKAAKVLMEASGRPVSTIHSYLSLKPKKDFTTGKMYLVKAGGYEVKSDTLIVIDESSMVDTPLLKIIRESVLRCKILYIGDKNQLAPVMEPISPVFAGDIPSVELKESMRFGGDIEELCGRLNTGVENTSFTPINHKPGAVEYLCSDDAKAEIIKAYGSGGLKPDDVKILTYTNEKAILYNQFIRREVLDLPEELSVGEFVVNNDAVYSVASSPPLKFPMIRVDSTWQVKSIDEDENFKGLACRAVTLFDIYGQEIVVRIPVSLRDKDFLLKSLAKQKDWTTFYLIKEGVADLRSAYASTVHKSQGSTYHTVFVDLTDIGVCTNPAVTTRLLNVACSRASTMVYLIGDLPNKYKG